MAYKPTPADLHAQNLAELKKRIKEKKLSGVYVFYGEEVYTMRSYYDAVKNAVGVSPLNVTTIVGDDFSLAAFADACDTTPATMDMFAEASDPADDYRVVRLIDPALSALSKSDEKHFFSRIADVDEGVIIVFWLTGKSEKGEKADKDGAGDDVNAAFKSILGNKYYKHITEDALTVCFRHEPPGSRTLVTWILRHFTHAGITVPNDVANFFCNYVGNDMTTLKNEIDKCIAFLRYENRDTLAEEDVRSLCRQSLSAKLFDVSTHTLAGKYALAMNAFAVLRDGGAKPELLFGTVSSKVRELAQVQALAGRGMNPAEIAAKTGCRDFVVRGDLALLRERTARTPDFTEKAAKICFDFDARLKYGRAAGAEVFEEFIFRLAAL